MSRWGPKIPVKIGLFFTIQHCTCVNRVSSSCKIGLKGYNFWRSYVFIVSHAKMCVRGSYFWKSNILRIVLPSSVMFL